MSVSTVVIMNDRSRILQKLGSRRSWEKEEIILASNMWKEGKTASDIGVKLGRSVHAVRGMIEQVRKGGSLVSRLKLEPKCWFPYRASRIRIPPQAIGRAVRLSRYFLPILKEDPVEATIASHRLMLRSGMIRQTSAGIYAWLPLGYRVLRKIEQIVREEQLRAGAIEMLMPTVQSADLWKQSGRYSDYGKEMLRITDRHDRDMLYGPTNEEMITDLFHHGARSYRDLPRNLFQIQWKFRDEIRPRFGVMRGREFLMKDGYSFDIDAEAGRRSYNRMFISYLKTFQRMGLQAIPMVAETGPIGGDLSHEFLILAETGETEVHCHRDLTEMPPPDEVDYNGDLEPLVQKWTGLYAATDDMHDPEKFAAAVPEDRRVTARGIEVGHIFFFGSKYSKSLEAEVAGPSGEGVPLESGSYGIGISRLAGGIIEACHDERGIVWPESVAPFRIGLVSLKPGSEADAVCERICGAFGDDILYDDTDERAGSKFSTMDLIGLPWRIVVGPRGLEKGTVELKHRSSDHSEHLSCDEVISRLGGARPGGVPA